MTGTTGEGDIQIKQKPGLQEHCGSVRAVWTGDVETRRFLKTSPPFPISHMFFFRPEEMHLPTTETTNKETAAIPGATTALSMAVEAILGGLSKDQVRADDTYTRSEEPRTAALLTDRPLSSSPGSRRLPRSVNGCFCRAGALASHSRPGLVRSGPCMNWTRPYLEFERSPDGKMGQVVVTTSQTLPSHESVGGKRPALAS